MKLNMIDYSCIKMQFNMFCSLSKNRFFIEHHIMLEMTSGNLAFLSLDGLSICTLLSVNAEVVKKVLNKWYAFYML